MPTILRFYQRDALEENECAHFDHSRTVMEMPTGSGKTTVAAKSTELSLPERTLFLADQNELCDQPLKVFKRVSNIYAALEKGTDRASLAASVVIGSSQTLARKNRLARYRPDHFQRIIVDEAHRGTDRDIEICDYFQEAIVTGMTATPYRENLKNLLKWYGGVGYSMKPTNFINLGFAPPEEILTFPVEVNLGNARTGMTPDGKEYKAEDVSDAIEPYFDAIAELIKEHAQGRFGIAYLPLIESSKKFTAALRRHGITCRHVDGDTPDRDLIIESFSRKEFSWLVNVGVASTGVDIPIADAFLCLRPMKSRALYQQCRGRVWRVLPGVIDHLPEKNQAEERCALIAASAKPNALIFDLLWQNDQLGACHPGDMYAESEYDARQIFERTKKELDPVSAMEVARRVQEEREAKVIEALEKAAVKSTGTHVPAGFVGGLLNHPILANYEPIAQWEMKPLTPHQKSALASFGVDPETVSGMGQARLLIEQLAFRIKSGFATLKQVRMLKEHNSHIPGPLQIRNVELMTIEDASRHIERIIRARRGHFS